MDLMFSGSPGMTIVDIVLIAMMVIGVGFIIYTDITDRY